MEDNQVVGIIKAVRKDCTGILLQTKEKEQWFKGIGNVLGSINQNLKGSTVLLTLTSNYVFTSLKVLEQSNQTVKDDYWARREVREKQQDTYRGKGAALNSAIDILTNSRHEGFTPKQFLTEAQSLAHDIIRWIEDDKA